MPVQQLPFVSVVMPAYNVEPYIAQAIRSVLAQTYTSFELLIADDHSKDNTLSIISAFDDSRIVRIANEKNMGYAGNMNALFKAAKGEYIVIQDADDYCSADRLQVLVDFLRTHAAIDMVGSSFIKTDEQGNEEKVNVPVDPAEVENSFQDMRDPLPVLNGSVMFRRKIVDAGLFFRDLVYVNRSQDDDWLFRVSEKFRLANVKDYLYYYRYNPASMTMNLSAVDYKSLFSGEYVRFLKAKRKETGMDWLTEKRTKEIEVFFEEKKNELTGSQPAYLELYIAHKYLAFHARRKTLQWLLKALQKNPADAFIWKKILFVLLGRKN